MRASSISQSVVIILMHPKLKILLGPFLFLPFLGITEVSGMQLTNQSVEKEFAKQSTSQISSDEPLSENNSIDESSNENDMDANDTIDEIDEIDETNDDDIDDTTAEISVTDEINEIARSGSHAVQIGPNSLVILSERRAITESELEEIERAEERIESNTDVFTSGGFASELLNNSQAQSSQEFSF